MQQLMMTVYMLKKATRSTNCGTGRFNFVLTYLTANPNASVSTMIWRCALLNIDVSVYLLTNPVPNFFSASSSAMSASECGYFTEPII